MLAARCALTLLNPGPHLTHSQPHSSGHVKHSLLVHPIGNKHKPPPPLLPHAIVPTKQQSSSDTLLFFYVPQVQPPLKVNPLRAGSAIASHREGLRIDIELAQFHKPGQG